MFFVERVPQRVATNGVLTIARSHFSKQSDRACMRLSATPEADQQAAMSELAMQTKLNASRLGMTWSF